MTSMLYIFMNAPIFLQIVDAKLVFMETVDRSFYFALSDLTPRECDMAKEFVEAVEFVPHRSIRVETKRVSLQTHENGTIRTRICRAFCIREIAQCISIYMDKCTRDGVLRVYCFRLVICKILGNIKTELAFIREWPFTKALISDIDMFIDYIS